MLDLTIRYFQITDRSLPEFAFFLKKLTQLKNFITVIDTDCVISLSRG